MADKKQESSFKVTDRRLFTADGELRSDVAEEVESPKASAPTATKAPSGEKTSAPAPVDTAADREMPAPPTSAEQDAQAAAYRQSSKDLDAQEIGRAHV